MYKSYARFPPQNLQNVEENKEDPNKWRGILCSQFGKLNTDKMSLLQIELYI